MAKQTTKRFSPVTAAYTVALIVAVLGVTVSFSGIVLAQVSNQASPIYIANVEQLVQNVEQAIPDSVGASFGASGTRFPNGISADSTSPSAGEIRATNLTATATSTLQEISLSSRYAIDLTLTATSTDSDGAGSITFTNDSVCRLAAIDISVGSSAGGRLGAGSPFDISAATSTAAGTWNGTNILATTTVATSSASTIDSVTNAGSGVGTAGHAFLVKQGEVVQVNWNGITGDPATSTSALTGMAGRLYLNCVTRW